MADNYFIDLKEYDLEQFRRRLESGDVLPGRVILKEKLRERFGILQAMGIENLQDISQALKNKDSTRQFSEKSGLPVDYLIILRREVNSYVPKPFNIGEIPGIDPVNTGRLAEAGIQTTKQLFERAKTRTGRTALCKATGVPEADLLELAQLSDLARINGVGPVFARLFYDAGVCSVETLLACQPVEVFERLKAVNAEKKYTKIMASLKDVQWCVEIAKKLPIVLPID